MLQVSRSIFWKIATMTNGTVVNEGAPRWVDSHLLLNAMAVLRRRVVAGRPDAVGVLDAVSGNFSSGQYLDLRGSVARVEYWTDWLECTFALVAAVHQHAEAPLLYVEIDDDEATFDLSPLWAISKAMLEQHASGQVAAQMTGIHIQLDGSRIRLKMFGPAVAHMSSKLAALPGIPLTVNSAGEIVVELA